MSRRQPGEVVHETKRGVKVRYLPSQGSTTQYRVTCPHGEGVNARTQADAREDAGLVNEWCVECAADAAEAALAAVRRP